MTKWRHWGVMTICFAALNLCAAPSVLAAERSLAGVRVFSPVGSALQKFGSPSQILTQGQLADVVMGPFGPQLTSVGAGMAGMQGRAGYGQSPVTGAAGAGYNTASTTPTPESNQTVYVFPAPGLSQYGIVSSGGGRVIGIWVVGQKGSPATSRGIRLGSTYAEVVEKYGYPESHEISVGGMLVTHYEEKSHVKFVFDRQRVVGIYVAAAD